MPWGKSVIDNMKYFAFEDSRICSDCFSNSYCKDRAKSPCTWMELSAGPHPNTIEVNLYGKRAEIENKSCIELSRVDLSGTNEAMNIVKDFPELLSQFGVEQKSLEHTNAKGITRKAVFNRGNIGKAPIEISEGSFDVFLTQIPVVKAGDYPTSEDLGFPIRYVGYEEFPQEFSKIYDSLVGFASKFTKMP
jgi:hypothetical protein